MAELIDEADSLRPCWLALPEGALPFAVRTPTSLDGPARLETSEEKLDVLLDRAGPVRR